MSRKQWGALVDSLKGQLVERDAVIEGLVCAALAGEHVLLLGPPGTAKSALANAFCGAFEGARQFSWLLSKFTAPEELFGPVSLSALKQDSYRRVTRGKLPEADIVFLDEIFKSSSAILNALLKALNERKFDNDGGEVSIPLRLAIGCSNELPTEAELGALYDRFLVRYWVGCATTAPGFLQIVTGADPTPSPQLTLKDWDQARAEVAEIQFDQLVAKSLLKLRTELQRDNVVLSDRRWKRAARLVCASAWLSGEKQASEDFFGVLSNALWNEPEQAVTVAAKVAAVSGGVIAEAEKIRWAVLPLLQVPALSDPPTKDEQTKLVDANREGSRALSKLNELLLRARTPAQKRGIEKEVKELQGVLEPLRAQTRQSLGI